MALRTPYLMFLGDALDQLAAKTASGVVHWVPDICIGQFRRGGLAMGRTPAEPPQKHPQEVPCSVVSVVCLAVLQITYVSLIKISFRPSKHYVCVGVFQM